MSPHSPDRTGVEWRLSGAMAAARDYTEADLRTLARVLSRACPHCKAPPGRYCHSTGSGILIETLDHQHVARRLGQSDHPER